MSGGGLIPRRPAARRPAQSETTAALARAGLACQLAAEQNERSEQVLPSWIFQAKVDEGELSDDA